MNSDLVSLSGATLTTDSRRVAEHFGKAHRNVLRDIRALIAAPDMADFAALNFEQCFEINDLANGKPEPMFRMTKDGFVMLAMGFTGAKARAMKVAYIGAFNRMTAELQQQSLGLWTQRQALEMRDMNIFVRAQVGSRFMNERRKALPVINQERERIEAEIQPLLFMVPQGGLQ